MPDVYVKAFDRREPFQVEHRIRRHDGEYRWVVTTGVPRDNVDGSFAGYIGTAIDVTEQKLAEEALSTISQKLIEAHEEESTRIARELHDDINQQLALVSMRLDSLKHTPPVSAAEFTQEIGAASRTDCGSRVRYSGAVAPSSLLESGSPWARSSRGRVVR